MGNDEAIIYGDRHGHEYRQHSQPGDTDLRELDEKLGIQTKTLYPNAVMLKGFGQSFVQLGVIMFDQETGERLQGDGSDGGQFESLWATLDRNGLNRLIRDARRLRDRVYGADE